MKLPVNCSFCNNSFLKHSSEIKRSAERGHKNHFCSNKCSLEFNKKLRSEIAQENRRKYYLNPKKCPNCESVIDYDKKSTSKFCSSSCSATFNQKDGGNNEWTLENRKKLSEKILSMSDLYKTGENVKCKICDVVFYKPKSSSQKCCSQKCGHESTKRSGVLLGNKNGTRGGYREKGGRGKQGWYKGYYCNSSWELAWVMYNLDHGIEFDRNTKGFQYSFNGKVYNFYPDFKIKNTEDFVEVKGYLDEKNKAKISSFPHKLTVLGKKEIVPFIKYAKSKYGEDYINLYE